MKKEYDRKLKSSQQSLPYK